MTHKVTPESEAVVGALAGYVGMNHKSIAKCIGITDKTLSVHYEEILRNAKPPLLINVAKTLYQKAIDGNVVACIFILKTQAGWKESGIDIDAVVDDKIDVIKIEVIGSTDNES